MIDLSEVSGFFSFHYYESSQVSYFLTCPNYHLSFTVSSTSDIIFLPSDTGYPDRPGSVAGVGNLRNDRERELIGRYVAGRGHQLKGEVGDEKWRQERLSGHENDDHGRRYPENHSAADKVTQVAEDDGSLHE